MPDDPSDNTWRMSGAGDQDSQNPQTVLVEDWSATAVVAGETQLPLPMHAIIGSVETDRKPAGSAEDSRRTLWTNERFC